MLNNDDMPLREARARYFRDNGFGADGGYAKRWVKVKLGPVPVWFPNTAARRRAVGLHDLHHIATGYQTDLAGEGEIAAWELAAGCGHYVAAWVLNIAALAMGLVIAPRRVAAAWARGRRTRTLYSQAFDDRWLGETVGALRARLGLG